MNYLPKASLSQAGDLAQLVSPSNKIYTIRLLPGGKLQTHRGVLEFDQLIGIPWGTQVSSHIGSTFFLLQPALGVLLQETRRNTQIMYPKDIGYVLVSMGIGPGTQVVEAGTGSGALTTALAWAVGDSGHVYSYESRNEVQNLAKKNISNLGLSDRVTFYQRDIIEGFDQTDIDAAFLDVPNPYDYLTQVRHALKSGGFFGTILPTVNQVAKLLPALHQAQFAFVDVLEIMLRYYKPIAQRLRPTDRMIAHTGYLVFGRSVILLTPSGDLEVDIDEVPNQDDDIEIG